MMKRGIRTIFHKKAQTAVELAVFGSILIFVIGLIVNQSVGFSQAQNQYLKAMRLAMKMSYLYSEGLPPSPNPKGVASRNQASVILLEDRLTVDSDKYGAINRAPYIINATASHSRHMFMPIEDDDEDAARVDVFVNGKHFPLTTGRYKWVCLSNNPDDCKDGDEPSTGEWDSDCATVTPRVLSNYDHEPSYDVWVYGAIGVPHPVGCRNLYKIVVNRVNSPAWCYTSCSWNLTADERFDLDRDGATDVPLSPPEARENFAWQWYRIKGVDMFKDYDAVTKPSASLDINLNNEVGIIFDPSGEMESQNITVDADSDLKEEMIVDVESDADGVITRLKVYDTQDGDMDLTISDQEEKPPSGFKQDLIMYTRLREGDPSLNRSGTYLRIEHGKLFALTPGKQFVRSVQKKDQIDIIERKLQLSNNTNRFCYYDGTTLKRKSKVDKVDNPVEVCCDSINCSEGETCFDALNVARTCMQMPDADNPYPMILVRSRLKDLHGRMWVTDTSADPYVNFSSYK